MRRRRLNLERLERRELLDASGLRITEFMASNDGSLLDAEGDDSDWLEVYNAGSATASLSGLYLTDDPDELTRWAFPSGYTLDPGAFLVVFASGKDDVLAGAELHTDFKLSAGGEFLAIVDQDGSTLIDSYAPEFPPQLTDVSYGLEMEVSGPDSLLLEEGALGSATLSTSVSQGLAWTELGYNDSAWTYSGPTGFGYEDSPGASTNFTAEIETTVPSGTTGLYLRVPFSIASLANLGSLSLDVRYDDGFVAYLNGQRIASANAPDTVTHESIATGIHNDGAAEQFQSFDVSRFLPELRLGPNVLAIQALNTDGSSDMLIEPRLVGRPSVLKTPGTIGHFTDATPGYGNGAESVIGFAEEPEFSVPHGFYDSSQTVAISTGTAFATIVYTTDGSTPQVDSSQSIVNGTLYQGPLSIDSTTTLRARAFRLGYEPSPTETQTYLFVDDVVYQQPAGETPGPGWPASNVNGQEIDYGMDPNVVNEHGAEAIADSLRALSTFSITTDLENLFDPDDGIYVNALNRGRDWERAASIEMIHPDGSDAGFQVDAGLRIRGGWSRNDGNPKHAFRFYYRSEYGASKLEYPVFGDEGASEFDVLGLRTAQNYSWSFRNPGRSYENTFVREVFARDLQRELDQPYTRSRYHHLYVNGVYFGLFQTQERVEDFYGESYFGGDKDDYDVVKADAHVTWKTEVSNGNDLAWRQLFDLAQGLADEPASNADNYWTMQGLNPDGSRNPDLPVLLDLDNLIDYMAITFYTGAYDTGITRFGNNERANNWFGIRNREAGDQGFQFFQHDAEHSLGSGDTDDIDRTGPFYSDNDSDYSYFNPGFLHQDLLVHEEYRLAFADRLRNYLFDGGPMTAQASRDRMQVRVDQVEAAILAESARWGDSKTEPPRGYDDWLAEIDTLLDPADGYFVDRTQTVLNQLVADDLYPSLAAPNLSLPPGAVASGTSLTISHPGPFALYTTDGSDPRLIGGGFSPNALLYASPITLDSSVTVSTRTYDLATQSWSALTSATYIASLPGDYDLDGEVDSEDYVVWHDNYGSTTFNAADGNGDGVVNAADYTIWQDNLGAMSASAPQLDEPTPVAFNQSIWRLALLLPTSPERDVAFAAYNPDAQPSQSTNAAMQRAKWDDLLALTDSPQPAVDPTVEQLPLSNQRRSASDAAEEVAWESLPALDP